MASIKLPRLGVNWLTQPELFRRYWDQAMNALEKPVLVDAVDDAAAAIAGVPIKGLYHTSGVVKQRQV